MGILYPFSAEFRADLRIRQTVLAVEGTNNIPSPVPNFLCIQHKHKNLTLHIIDKTAEYRDPV